MPTVSSSDSNVQVDVHAAWSSALIYSPLSGAVTIYRDGVAIAMLAPNEAVYYDHYPPVGTVSYTASNGTTTSTAATVTIGQPFDHASWLKSSADPNLSRAVTLRPLEEVQRTSQAGIFSRPGESAAYVILDAPGPRRTAVTVACDTAAERDAVLACVQAGPVLYQPCPDLQEPSWWALATQTTRRTYHGVAGGLWDVTMDLVEADVRMVQRQLVIPGWSWADVQAMYPSWSALQAANTSWLALLRRGVA